MDEATRAVMPRQEDAAERPHLYEDIAARIRGMIESRTFRPGERLPSVRALARRMNVSINTVLSAYGLLENRRLIEARPQSGYFVASPVAEPVPLRAAQPVELAAEELTAKPVVRGEDAARIIRSLYDPRLVPLGTGAPNARLLPIARLNRMLASEVRKHPTTSISYAPTAGQWRLRTQVAKRMVAAGCTLSTEDVLITSGSVEAMTLALQATCQPGQTVAMATPVYPTLLHSIQWLGLKVLEVPACPRDGISLDVLAYLLRREAIHACLVIANFNNPLGSLMPDARKEQLVELLAAHRVPLIEDDVYGDLAFAADRPRSLKAFDRDGLVLHCSSFSKTLAPGYRVGWIAPGRFDTKVRALKGLFNIATASPTQLAVAEFLANGGYDRHLRTLRRTYCRQMAKIRDAIGRYFPPDTQVTTPQGGTVLWVEMPGRVDALRLYEQAKAKGIGIAPGPIFTVGDGFRNAMRISAGLWSAEVEAALRTLGALAAA